MEKFARWGAGDAPGSALLDCKEAGISEQSYYRWRKKYGADQKGLRCCPPTSVDRRKSVTSRRRGVHVSVQPCWTSV